MLSYLLYDTFDFSSVCVNCKDNVGKRLMIHRGVVVINFAFLLGFNEIQHFFPILNRVKLWFTHSSSSVRIDCVCSFLSWFMRYYFRPYTTILSRWSQFLFWSLTSAIMLKSIAIIRLDHESNGHINSNCFQILLCTCYSTVNILHLDNRVGFI